MEDYKKKYEDLVDRVRTMAKAQPLVTKKAIEMHFPEIVEPEYEKIRKAIHIYLDWLDGRKDYAPKGEYSIMDMIAYLEKQGKQKPTQPVWKYKKNNTPLLRDSLILNKYGCVAKSPSGALVSDVWVLDYDELAKLPKEEYDKQGEKGAKGNEVEIPNSEQKSAWSEEGDSHICNIINWLDVCKAYNQDAESIKLISQHIAWLKSLRPQNHWKPSEQDILLFERIIQGKSDPKDFQASLTIILERLKEL